MSPAYDDMAEFQEPARETVAYRIGSDKYGRIIAEVLRQRDYGNLGLRLALGGYVALWMCPSTQQGYQAAQGIAKSKRAGIWSLPGLHQTPWLYR